MSYIEVAVSDGPGTLVEHFAQKVSAKGVIMEIHAVVEARMEKFTAVQTLAEQEYQEFTATHGGTVAV